jgi:hypothetical protein
MLRVVLSPIEEELPFLTGVQLSLLERPYLDFDIRWGWLVAACWQRRECGALLRGTCRRAGGSQAASLPCHLFLRHPLTYPAVALPGLPRRVLGGDVMSLPALGSWLRSSVAGILQER